MSDEIVEELRQIKKLLEPKPPAPPEPEPKNLILQFKSFLKNYKVMGLAVAFIIGLYLGGLVQALVKDLLLPLIGLLIPGLSDLGTLKGVLFNQEFLIGDFLSALITFIIVAFVIFLIVKIMKRFKIE